MNKSPVVRLQHAVAGIPILKAEHAPFPGVDVSRLAGELQKKKVVVSARHGYLRVSPHFFNNEEDLERLAKALAYCCAK